MSVIFGPDVKGGEKTQKQKTEKHRSLYYTKHL